MCCGQRPSRQYGLLHRTISFIKTTGQEFLGTSTCTAACNFSSLHGCLSHCGPQAQALSQNSKAYEKQSPEPRLWQGSARKLNAPALSQHPASMLGSPGLFYLSNRRVLLKFNSLGRMSDTTTYLCSTARPGRFIKVCCLSPSCG